MTEFHFRALLTSLLQELVRHGDVLIDLARLDGHRQRLLPGRVDASEHVTELTLADDLGQVDSGSVELEVPGRAGVVCVLLVNDLGVIFAQHLEEVRKNLYKDGRPQIPHTIVCKIRFVRLK